MPGSFVRTLHARVLGALVLATLIPLGLVGFGVGLADRQVLTEQSGRELVGLARGLSGQTEVHFAGLLRESQAIAALPQVVSMDREVQRLILAEVFHEHTDFARISTYSISGEPVASSHPDLGVNVGFRDSFQAAARLRQQRWEIADAVSTNRPSLLVFTPIRDAERSIVGILRTLVDLQTLSARLAQVPIGRGGQAFIVDDRGRIVAHADVSLIRERRDVSHLGIPVVGRPPGPGTIGYEMDGERQISGFAPVSSAGWTVVVERPEAEVTAAADQSLRLLLLGMSVTAFVAVLIAIGLARTLSGPVRRVAEAARAFGSGDASVPLPKMAGRPLEIGMLVDAFATMRQSIQTQLELRRAAEEQLRQAQKMEAIGVLAGGIAHDFSNLLTAIDGASDLLMKELQPAGRAYRHAQQVRIAGQKAAELTSQLLAFSRRQVLQPTVLDLNAVVTDTGRLLKRLLGEDIKLSLVLDPDLRPIRADRGQLAQVLLNLAVNARDAMPTGGKLRIETANVVDEQGPLPQPNGCVRLAVSDTGVGIDVETQAHVFEPFFTTKEPGKGTGLGLSMVYGIVKQSSGEIQVSSAAGAGATFTIFLPAVDAPLEAQASPESDLRAPRGSETVLLVEDEPGVREVVGSVLQSAGYGLLAAGNPDEARRLYQHHQESVDILLADLVMPGGSGFELAQELATARPGMKVLFMSGYTADVALRQGLSESNVAFLKKPFSPDALLRKLRDVLDAN